MGGLLTERNGVNLKKKTIKESKHTIKCFNIFKYKENAVNLLY